MSTFKPFSHKRQKSQNLSDPSQQDKEVVFSDEKIQKLFHSRNKTEAYQQIQQRAEEEQIPIEDYDQQIKNNPIKSMANSKEQIFQKQKSLEKELTTKKKKITISTIISIISLIINIILVSYLIYLVYKPDDKTPTEKIIHEKTNYKMPFDVREDLTSIKEQLLIWPKENELLQYKVKHFSSELKLLEVNLKHQEEQYGEYQQNLSSLMEEQKQIQEKLLEKFRIPPNTQPSVEFSDKVYTSWMKNSKNSKLDFSTLSYSQSQYPYGNENTYMYGLENLHKNCNQDQKCELLIQFQKEEKNRFAIFDKFWIDGIERYYQLHWEIVQNISEKKFDSFVTYGYSRQIHSYHNNARWTTYDADNDTSDDNCSLNDTSVGPGWFNSCFFFHVFGRQKDKYGIIFFSEDENFRKLDSIEMSYRVLEYE